MNYYESVVIDYLRADRAVFVNTECCIQLNEGENPDITGPHWYCDAVAVDFRSSCIFLCEISYSRNLGALTKRLSDWHNNWPLISAALHRDSCLPSTWPCRPWLFVPQEFIPLLLRRLEKVAGEVPPNFISRITPLELVQPWRYRSWNRRGEAAKPAEVPESMQV
jgi:hypothetical protein